MKRLLLAAIAAALCTLTGVAAKAQDSSGSLPLACIATDTYFPRGDHWAVLPGTSVQIRFQADGPLQQATVSEAAAQAAVQRAFAAWTSANCGSGTPSVQVSVGQPYPTRDAGDSNGSFNNVIYWAIDPNTWSADSLTVALTTNLYTDETGYEATSDMAFNNMNFVWRTTDNGTPVGCVVGSTNNCYDIQSVALHEAGHFFGFNHVACTDADMYPSASGSITLTGISHNEAAGICALYPPRTVTSGSSEGQACTTSTDCAGGLACLRQTNGAAGQPIGWCAKTCTDTNGCDDAYICSAVPNHTGTYCVPGIHLKGVPVSTQSATSDLCKQCTLGSQCQSNMCVADGSGTSICTQSCTATTGCPDGFACTPTQGSQSVCWPLNPQTCTAPGATLNEECYAQAPSGSNTTDYTRSCAQGLVCFLFQNTPAVTGSCLQACDASGNVCPSGQTCCYGQDSTGACITTPPAGQTTGACFQITPAGSSCVTPIDSICEPGDSCVYLTNPTLAKCYRGCGSGTCDDGETCQSFSSSDSFTSQSICCDASTFDPTNPVTCAPKAGPCRRQVGVTCTQNSDCESNYCLNYGGVSACSSTCTASTDCPAASDDVNGDGVPDGGSKCQVISGSSYCWPATHPASEPACAIQVATPQSTSVPGEGQTSGDGGCSATHAPEWLALLVVVLGLRLRRIA